MPDTDGSARSGIQVIARAASVLRVMKTHPEGMSLGQIATAISLPRSTVQRIVQALQAEGFVLPGGERGRLRIGPELAALAQATRYNTVEQCRGYLLDLSAATGETADLSVLRGDAMIFLDQISGTQRLRATSAIGEAFPLTTTANGRACLARMARGDALARAQQEWAQTGVEPDEASFDVLLDQIAACGLAHDEDDHAEGISAIGFAFEDWSGDLIAISVPVPSSRYLRQKPKIETALHAAQKAIETIMYTGRRA